MMRTPSAIVSMIWRSRRSCAATWASSRLATSQASAPPPRAPSATMASDPWSGLGGPTKAYQPASGSRTASGTIAAAIIATSIARRLTSESFIPARAGVPGPEDRPRTTRKRRPVRGPRGRRAGSVRLDAAPLDDFRPAVDLALHELAELLGARRDDVETDPDQPLADLRRAQRLHRGLVQLHEDLARRLRGRRGGLPRRYDEIRESRLDHRRQVRERRCSRASRHGERPDLARFDLGRDRAQVLERGVDLPA